MPGGFRVVGPHTAQVIAEQPVGLFAPHVIALPQYPRRVHGGVAAGAVFQRVPAPAVARQLEARAEHRGGSGRAQADDDLRPHPRDLAQQPRLAGAHMAAFRPLVQAGLAAPLVVEMLDRIGQVQRGAVDAEFGQGTVQQLAGRPCKGPATQVLGIAGLLADHHHPRVGRALAEHHLGGRLPQRALPAASGLRAQ